MGQRPDAIRQDIEATRDRMTRTLEELEDRLSPRRIARRRTDRVREAMSQMKETVMGNSEQSATAERNGETRNRAQHVVQTVRGASGTARRRTQSNPIAAGVIAFGAGLLAASLLPRTRREQQMTTQVTERLEPLRDEARSAGKEVMHDVTQVAERGMQETKQVAQDAFGTVREQAQGAAETVQEDARGAAETVEQDVRAAVEDVRQEAGERADQVRSKSPSAGNGNGDARSSGKRRDTQTAEGQGETGADETETHAPDYESMTVEELHSLAAERDITGRSGMKKQELIEALRQ